MVTEPPFDLSPYRELYPFESHFFTRKGYRIHYVDEGPRDAAETLVMVHGNPTWSFHFRELIKAFRPRYRVVVPDHVGCGLSDKPDDSAYDYRLASRVEDLEALLSHLGIEQNIDLVVHDWGGMIGTAFATRHPGKILRLVVFNTAAFHLPRGKSFPWALSLARTPIGAFLIRSVNAFSYAASLVCARRRPLPELVRKAYLAPYGTWANRIATLRFVQDIPLDPREPSYEFVAQVERDLQKLSAKPVLICWGERDFVFDNDFRDEWTNRFPDAKLVSFPEAGHYVLEDACEEIVPLVDEFLGRPQR
jgi:cis-3-alkyl-4-acyloxetan-2-one decarboxylase